VTASATQPFAWRTALQYSVANLGASVVYALFNFAMPLYLAAYNLHPSLIGLLANERSFVGAFVQPIVGRLSDRTRTRLGRRRP
jgi:Na+/melibiose symporter-like transporter